MAEEMVATYSDKPVNQAQKTKDFEEHTRTYAGFMAVVKWSIIVLVVILIGMYFFFVH